MRKGCWVIGFIVLTVFVPIINAGGKIPADGIIEVDGWGHVTDSFKFTCDGAGDMRNTPCYGKSPPQSGEFPVSGPYTLISKEYSCETPSYDGSCWGGSGLCKFRYGGEESKAYLSVSGMREGEAHLVKGSLNIKYTCHTCGHGTFVWYVKPTNFKVDVYYKTFSSCDAFCREVYDNANGREEGGECNCYCDEGYGKQQLVKGVWGCVGDEIPQTG
ncbi:MAG: hypothetical protein KAU03_00985, partial [Candidatus Altiarchaeales archaeon]|nr:hypothetical protein [Candidatus Altiarchaeales archaeon]